MALDILKLEKIKRKGTDIIARCPACAEEGRDSKGEHLFMRSNGRFGCVLFPGLAGLQHRQRIFALVGIKDNAGMGNVEILSAAKRSFIEVQVHSYDSLNPKVIDKDILGHLGHLNIIQAQKNSDIDGMGEESNVLNNLKISVPNVPTEQSGIKKGESFAPEDEKLLEGAIAGEIANEAKAATLEELINYAMQREIKCFMCKGYLGEMAKGEKLSNAGEYHLRACLSAQRNLYERSDVSLF